MTEHSPTPWKLRAVQLKSAFVVVIDAVKHKVITLRPINIADARHIVLCVNAHDELVTALEDIVGDIDVLILQRRLHSHIVEGFTAALRRARAALARAKAIQEAL